MADASPTTRERRTTPGPALYELFRARLLEFVRDPAAIFWTFGFPLILATALGLAFRNAPPDPVRVVVVDDAASAWVKEALAREEGVALRAAPLDEARQLLRRGEADLLASSGGSADVRFRYDDTRAEARVARLVVERALERARGREDVLEEKDERVTEPGSRYIDFLLPGLVGMNLLGSAMWGLGYSVVDSRKRKLLKRYAATPMKHSEFLLSLMLSRLVFVVVEVAALLVIGRFAFGVVCQGSVVSAFTLAIFGGFSFSGLAMLIASRPDNTEVASGWLNAAMLPMWLLSGSFFSASRFPEWLQPVVQALPLTALNDALRAIYNEGSSWTTQLDEIGLLVLWGVIPFAIALRVFRWQ